MTIEFIHVSHTAGIDGLGRYQDSVIETSGRCEESWTIEKQAERAATWTIWSMQA
jgi:hypothetical protein